MKITYSVRNLLAISKLANNAFAIRPGVGKVRPAQY